MLAADIQKSATIITFSTTALLLTLFALKVNDGNDAFSTSMLQHSWECCVNIVFSANNKVLKFVPVKGARCTTVCASFPAKAGQNVARCTTVCASFPAKAGQSVV